MTDQTEAPERCAECDCESGGTACTWIAAPSRTYTRDELQAAVAAALEHAASELEIGAHIMSHYGSQTEVLTYQNAAKRVRALITPEQSAALDRVKEEARREALDEAAR